MNNIITDNKPFIRARLANFINQNWQIIMTFVISLLSALIVLTFYILVVVKDINYQIVAIDLQSLMKEVTLKAFNDIDSASKDKQADVASNDIKQGAAKIEQAIAIVAGKCNCTIIQKQALAYDKNIPDYTNEVRNEIYNLGKK
ncbi:hypothetical protein [Aquella oligotrophica]|uniref:Uncharacterized protein n=1 Tax=Aquella oligotrophica TaxID=2067065 RepID=A0A2I7N6J1_9NEIS|nr:hypothetical protein [Aquella oligotrophica]AUR52096.1 hypothetical protein CUN60_07205 [Aquella oligotrophica]